VGYGGRRAISKDGIAWTNDVQDVAKGGDDEWLLRDVGYGGGSFVSVGWHVKTAPDAVTWTDAGKMGQWLGGIAYGKGTWVAAGGYGRRAYSTDGKTWKDADDGGLHGAFRGLPFGGDRWVAVGDGGRRSTSTDGVAWEEGTGDGASSLGEVAYGGGTFVAIGGKTVLRSSDGKAWKSSTAAIDLDSVAWDGARFVAVGSGKAIASNDGASWMDLGSGPSGSLAYGGGAFVAMAWGGAVYRSTDGATWKKVTTLAGDNSFARVRYLTP
ncbi:MAG: WD40/YVTN/BNR-like repeat-containing protein, partial [Polyangiales bacterium]